MISISDLKFVALDVTDAEMMEISALYNGWKLTPAREKALRIFYEQQSYFEINSRSRSNAHVKNDIKNGVRTRNIEILEKHLERITETWRNKIIYEVFKKLYPQKIKEVSEYWVRYISKDDLAANNIDESWELIRLRDPEELLNEYFTEEEKVSWLQYKPNLCRAYKWALQETLQKESAISTGAGGVVRQNVIDELAKVGLIYKVWSEHYGDTNYYRLTRKGVLYTRYLFGFPEFVIEKLQEKARRNHESRLRQEAAQREWQAKEDAFADAYNQGEMAEEFQRGCFVDYEDIHHFYGTVENFRETMKVRQMLKTILNCGNQDIPTILWNIDRHYLHAWLRHDEPLHIPVHHFWSEKSGIGWHRPADIEIDNRNSWTKDLKFETRININFRRSNMSVEEAKIMANQAYFASVLGELYEDIMTLELEDSTEK